MIQRSLRITLEVVIGVLAGLAILAGVGVWRLSSGPVHLEFLTPYLEEALKDPRGQLKVDVGETVLTWGGWTRAVDLRVRDIRVIGTEEETVAVLPDASVTLSTRALVQGIVAPTEIDIIGASVELVRDREGVIHLGTAVPGDSADRASKSGDFTTLLPGILNDLISRPDPKSPSAYFKVFRIVDGKLHLRDEELGLDWEAPRASLELRRDGAGLAGEASVDIVQRDQLARLETAFIYEKSSRFVDLAVNFTDFRPAAFPALASRFAALQGFEVPLSGTASATLGLDGSLEAIDFDIGGSSGSFWLIGRWPEPRPIQQLVLKGGYDSELRRIVFERAGLTFGDDESAGPSLVAKAVVDMAETDIEIDGSVELKGLLADQFDRYWPTGMSEGGRDWVTDNIKKGVVEQADMKVALRLPNGEIDALEIEEFGGSLRYRDLDVHYLRPMPPVTGVSGKGTFDLKALRFAIDNGVLDDLRIMKATAVIDNFGKPPAEMLDVKLTISGPVRTHLELLNHKRLRLLETIGIDPAETSGQFDEQASFRFPLIEELTFDDVVVKAAGTATQAVVKNALLGQDLTEGTLELEVDNNGMRLVGPAKLGGVPMELEWVEDFTGEKQERSLYKAEVPAMDDEQRVRFGFDVWDGLKAVISASVIASVNRDSSILVRTALNLKNAELDAPEIKWSKPIGTEGKAHFLLRMQGDRLVDIKDLEIEAGTLRLKGEARFDETGSELVWAGLQELDFDDTSLKDVEVRWAGERTEVRAGSGVVDAAPFLEEAEAEPKSAEGSAKGDEGASFRITAPALRQVSLGPNRYLETVSLDLDRNPQGWNRIEFKGGIPPHLWTRAAAQGAKPAANRGDGPKNIDVGFRPRADGGHELAVTSNDLGAVLRALDIVDTMEGGDIKMTGEMPQGQPLNAEVEVTDFKMIDAPFLSRLLLVASLTGILEGLTGSGIGFDRLTGTFTLDKGVMRTELIRAYGSSLGITAKGRIDFNRSAVNGGGTIVPAYLLNRILNNIPLLGTILTGGKGEGLVAFVYNVEGNLEEPNISVNPLSALAPGFLRGVFSGSGVDDDEPTVFPPGKDK